MVGRSKQKPSSRPSLTVHQVVAYNFRRAREEAGWTQAQTSEQLEPFLGFRLNQAGVSAIEKTFDSERRRNIDVAEVLAFARCFNRPVGWFFLPPDGHGADLIEPITNVAGDEFLNLPAVELIAHAVGTPAGWQALIERLSELLRTDGKAALEAIEYALSARRESFEEQINLRRSTLQQVTLARLAGPTDEAVTKLAEALVHLVQLTPEGFLKLRGKDTAEALRLLAEGDRLVEPFVAEAEKKRRSGRPSAGGYDDLYPLDVRKALGLEDGD